MRRDFVAGKIVISRRSIDESGQTTVYELLKREPSVTVSSDGRLGLLGLPGYTQLLIDGKPAVPGRNPMEIDLVLVDKIEIVKGAMAEYGPFGIAGTINIVSKRVERKPTASLRFGGSMGPQAAEANVAWSETVRSTGAAWTLSNRVSLRKREADFHEASATRVADTRTGPVVLTDLARENRTDGLQTFTLTSSAGYRYSESTDVTLTPSIMVWRTTSDGREEHRPPPGSASTELGISQARMDASGTLGVLSMPVSLKHETSGGSRLEIEFSPSRSFVDRRKTRLDLPTIELSANPVVTRQSTTHQRQAVDFMRINVTPNWVEDHSTKFGVDIGYSSNRFGLDPLIDRMPDPAYVQFGNRQFIKGPRHSAFIQDEWTLNKRWAATAGVTTEWRRLTIEESSVEAKSSYRITSPSLHVAHKLDDAGDRRLRLSLARSFSAPDSDQLTQRPTINPLAPCDAAVGCGSNSIEYADTAGNPSLRPERATGVTISYEHSFGNDSLLSLDGFNRRLKDVVGEVVDLEAVPWASERRYVIRPQNLGSAWTTGLSADARINLSDIESTWPKVELKAGATVAHSRLKTVPGPDNRLVDQSPWSAKIGGRYKLMSMPVEVSLDASWTPGHWYRTAINRRLYQGRREDMSAQIGWTVSSTLKFRLAASNLFSRDFERATVFGEGAHQDASIWARKESSPLLVLTVEMKI